MNERVRHKSTMPPGIITPGALKIKEAAAYLGGISQITVRRLIERGLIKPNRALRHILISKAELDRFLSL
jgi:excisionase family DNA binding protein